MARKPSGALGAYGLRLSGLDAPELLVEAGPGWPPLEIARERGRETSDHDSLGPDRGSLLLLGGGEVVIEREPARATFRTPEPLSDDELVHPYLGPAAAIYGRWLGRESFHGGAFALGGGAWILAGDRGAGKSSTLAVLAGKGVPILTDDVVALDDGRVLAGPRSIDLRADAAQELGIGERLKTGGGRERWRVTLPGVPYELPLRGWVFAGWESRTTEIVPVSPHERLVRLAASRVLRVAADRPQILLELAGLPAWEFRRDPSWSGLEAAADRLLAALGG